MAELPSSDQCNGKFNSRPKKLSVIELVSVVALFGVETSGRETIAPSYKSEKDFDSACYDIH